MSIPISVNGPQEGELQLQAAGEYFMGSFTVSQKPSAGPNKRILYRLRVRESSIMLSKTYGILGRNAISAPSPSVADTIHLYADKAVVSKGRMGTVRVEYVDVTEDQYQTLFSEGVDKASCRTYFEKGSSAAAPQPTTYDIRCVVIAPDEGSPSPNNASSNNKKTPLKPSRNNNNNLMTAVVVLPVVAAAIGALVGIWAMRRKNLGG